MLYQPKFLQPSTLRGSLHHNEVASSSSSPFYSPSSSPIITTISQRLICLIGISTILGVLLRGRRRVRRRRVRRTAASASASAAAAAAAAAKTSHHIHEGMMTERRGDTSSPKPFSVILLSGGKGTRMMDKTTTTNNNKVLPKQYIPLWDGRSSAIRAFDTFISHPLTRQIVIVCAQEFEPIFRDHINAKYGDKCVHDQQQGHLGGRAGHDDDEAAAAADHHMIELIIPYISDTSNHHGTNEEEEEPPMLRIDGKYKDIPKRIVRIGFARPGPERQDSVRNGINALRYVIPSSSICIHDAARPLITREAITRTALEASRAGGGGGGGGRGGAAVLAVKAKATIKKIITKGKDSGGNEGLSSMNDESRMMIVESTPDRNTMWEAQTPQILPYGVLNDGLDIITQSSSSSAPIEVTDDVSLVEILHSRGLYEDINVAAAEGDYDNIKLTTPQDLVFCNSHIQQQEESR